MFHPLPVYIGLRYVRARSHEFFVSFITWASLGGVCVGVAALIVILSVMNGFEGELRERLLTLGAQVRVAAAAPPGAAPATPAPEDWSRALRRAEATDGVASVAEYVELQALAVRRPEMLPVLLRGIDPQSADGAAELRHAITQGRLTDLAAGSGRLIVGAVIAEHLGLALGDSHTVIFQTVSASVIPVTE